MPVSEGYREYIMERLERVGQVAARRMLVPTLAGRDPLPARGPNGYRFCALVLLHPKQPIGVGKRLLPAV